MIAMSIDVPAWIGVFVTTLMMVSIIGAGIAVARSAGTKASVDLLTTINDELRSDNASLREALETERRDRLTDKHECDAQIAEMRGELNAVTNAIGESIGREVGQAVGVEVIRMLRAELDRPEVT